MFCGDPFHTNGWCPNMWRQTCKVIRDKGDVYSEQGRKRLLWNRPSETQLAVLTEALQSSSDPDEMLTAIVHDEHLSPLLENNSALREACGHAPNDFGESLFTLVAEWNATGGSA